jgi:hypothetical protein
MSATRFLHTLEHLLRRAWVARLALHLAGTDARHAAVFLLTVIAVAAVMVAAWVLPNPRARRYHACRRGGGPAPHIRTPGSGAALSRPAREAACSPAVSPAGTSPGDPVPYGPPHGRPGKPASSHTGSSAGGPRPDRVWMARQGEPAFKLGGWSSIAPRPPQGFPIVARAHRGLRAAGGALHSSMGVQGARRLCDPATATAPGGGATGPPGSRPGGTVAATRPWNPVPRARRRSQIFPTTGMRRGRRHDHSRHVLSQAKTEEQRRRVMDGIVEAMELSEIEACGHTPGAARTAAAARRALREAGAWL